MQKVTASIVVCTCNRAESLAGTLRSLAFVKIPPGLKAELIVVDNGSAEDTAQVVRNNVISMIPSRLVREPRKGLSYARNAGITESKGDILLFTDDDVRTPQSWIEHMTQPIREGSADAVAGGVRIAPHLERAWMKDRHFASLADTSRRALPTKPELVGANMAFCRQVLKKVPGFDTELGAGTPRTGEETLFSLQLIEAGFRIASAPGDAIEHHFALSRLERKSFLSEAERCGRFFAYLDHHWAHRKVEKLPLRWLRSQLRLATWRRLNRGELTREEGASEQELEYLFSVAYYKAYSEMVGTVRLYDRRGLAKRVGASAPQRPMLQAA